MSAGAVLAGATPEEVAACEVYAEKIGLAFQSKMMPCTSSNADLAGDAACVAVADDILDCTATSEELGKTAGKDESVNKTTYVKLLGVEKSKSEALRIVNEAKAALDRFGDRAIPLQALADFIVTRKN